MKQQLKYINTGTKIWITILLIGSIYHLFLIHGNGMITTFLEIKIASYIKIPELILLFLFKISWIIKINKWR